LINVTVFIFFFEYFLFRLIDFCFLTFQIELQGT